MTGRGVRVAIVDSGVFAAHPHVGGVAGGVAIEEDLREGDDYVDRLGHGTAVTAVIREKAPEAELYAVRVFDRALSTSLSRLVRAIDWAARAEMHIINLSLGTRRIEHEPALVDAVKDAAAHDVVIVSAQEDEDGVRWLPGSLAMRGVIGVQVDWTCPRDEFRVATRVDDGVVFRASGYPRPIPGVPPARNLNGVSFAVANMTSFVARALGECPGASYEQLLASLVNQLKATSAAAPPL
jgi:subtilisin family serine protease